MAVKIAITGFGRIGRLILRAIYELNHQDIKVVAINASRGDAASNAHLLKYDSAHGKFNADIKTNDHEIIINGDIIKFYSTRNPEDLPWGELNVDLGTKYNLKNSQGLIGINYFNYSNPIDNNGDGFTDLTLQHRVSIFNKINTKSNTLAFRYFYEDRWGGQMN